MPSKDCPCGSGRDYSDCCDAYLNGKHKPATAEELMRSRFTAYVVHAIDYLVNTTHPSSRKASLKTDIEHTADTYHWLSLQVVSASAGTVTDKVGKVVFIAHYRRNDGRLGIHKERSRFKKHNGHWLYLDGKEL